MPSLGSPTFSAEFRYDRKRLCCEATLERNRGSFGHLDICSRSNSDTTCLALRSAAFVSAYPSSTMQSLSEVQVVNILDATHDLTSVRRYFCFLHGPLSQH
ncbi:hypothetical protein ABKN59_011765 [Abortiporus biennis]